MALFGRETEQEKERAEAYRRWLQAQNPYAIASIVLGIFSLIELGVLWVLGMAGIVLGIVALRQISGRMSGAPQTRGRGFAWSGIVTSAISLVIATLLYLRIF